MIFLAAVLLYIHITKTANKGLRKYIINDIINFKDTHLKRGILNAENKPINYTKAESRGLEA